MSDVVVAGPPESAVGGVATHTSLLVGHLDATRFDQWWPLRDRSPHPVVRAVVHALAVLRWTVALVVERPRVAHLQVTAPGVRRDVIHLRIARWLGRGTACHVHTSGFLESTEPSPADEGLRQVLQLSDRVIVMSRTLREAIDRRHPDASSKVVFIPNPAPALAEPDHGRSRTDGTGAVTLLCVGEVCSRKGQAGLVTAAERLSAEGLPVQVHLVGPWGELSSEERRRIDGSSLTRHLGTLRGDDLTATYDQAEIFVLFSSSEAEPLAMLEAMSRGLPVVSTRVGGIPETLAAVPGNGLVPPGDVERLVEALRTLASRPRLRAAIGAENRRYVAEQRSPEAHVAAVEQVHRRVGRAACADTRVLPSAGPRGAGSAQ